MAELLNIHVVAGVVAEEDAKYLLVEGGEVKFPEDEILDVRWFSYEEIVNMKDNLRSPRVLNSVDAHRKLQGK